MEDSDFSQFRLLEKLEHLVVGIDTEDQTIISDLANLRSLHLFSGNITLRRLTNLKCLELEDEVDDIDRITANSIEHLSLGQDIKLPRMNNLKELTLNYNEGIEEYKSLTELNLYRIEVSTNRVYDDDVIDTFKLNNYKKRLAKNGLMRGMIRGKLKLNWINFFYGRLDEDGNNRFSYIGFAI